MSPPVGAPSDGSQELLSTSVGQRDAIRDLGLSSGQSSTPSLSVTFCPLSYCLLIYRNLVLFRNAHGVLRVAPCLSHPAPAQHYVLARLLRDPEGGNGPSDGARLSGLNPQDEPMPPFLLTLNLPGYCKQLEKNEPTNLRHRTGLTQTPQFRAQAIFRSVPPLFSVIPEL